VLHFGHFVHSPSGMSRFLDLEPVGLSFLGNGGALLADGGVNAGSTVSAPSFFLVKVVVAINNQMILNSARHCPDANIIRAGGQKRLRTRTRGRARREQIGRASCRERV